MSRIKTGSLAFQIKTEFNKMLSIGESKFLDKKADRTQDKVYSWETYKTYLKHCNYFTKWAKENYGVKTLEQAKPFINQYLKQREEQGLSAFTLKLERSALAKLYQISSKELYQTKSRLRVNITRSRGGRVRDKHFSEKNHQDLVDFCRGTGLRRAELSQIRGNALKIKNGQYFLEVTKATKGGRTREVEISGNIERIVELLEKSGENKVLKKYRMGQISTPTGRIIAKQFIKNMQDPLILLKKKKFISA